MKTSIERKEFTSSFISLQMAGCVYRLLRRTPQFSKTCGSSHELNMENESFNVGVKVLRPCKFLMISHCCFTQDG